jgi:hypothetical protein
LVVVTVEASAVVVDDDVVRIAEEVVARTVETSDVNEDRVPEGTKLVVVVVVVMVVMVDMAGVAFARLVLKTKTGLRRRCRCQRCQLAS